MRTPHIIGLAGIVEASYNAGGTITPATDGIQLAESFDLQLAYGNDGSRVAPPGTLGYQKRVAPIGATASATLKIEPKGSGSAYSASVKPVGHVLRRLAGWEAAVTTTGGAEKWVYTPSTDPASVGSGALDLYAYGEKFPLTGVLADWTLGADGPVVPLEEFAIQGLLGSVDDVAVPGTLAYPYPTLLPPLSAGAGLFTLGLFTAAVLRKWQIKMGRSISPLLNQNTAAGHAGFRSGRRTFQLEVTFESPAKATTPYHAASTIDSKRLYDAGTEVSWSIVNGSAQYNKRTLSGPKAQIMAPPKSAADGDTVVTTLTLQLNPTTLGSNDEVTDTWD